MTAKGNPPDFLNGLVFGFDVGTGSIGYAVRNATEFKDVGVMICPENTGQTKDRTQNRRQRRTLDHRQARRDWFAENLAGILNLRLHEKTRLPVSAWNVGDNGSWRPNPSFGAGKNNTLVDPVRLRVCGLKGEPLNAEELFTAMAHAIKRRGPSQKVPWSKTLAETKRREDEKAKESASDTVPPDQVSKEFEAARKYLAEANGIAPETVQPAHFLARIADENAKRRAQGEAAQPQRKRAWPRHLVEAEVAASLKAQKENWPQLKEIISFADTTGKQRSVTMAEWLLHGNSAVMVAGQGDEAQHYHLFHRNDGERQRAPFTFQAARIHNRRPGLDLIEPRDDFGRPHFVMDRSRPEYKQWQVEVALLGFRVLDLTSLRKNKPKIVPPAEALAELREIIARTEKLSLENLREWVKPYKEKGLFDLEPNQTDLVGKGEGRGRFSSFGLKKAIEIIRPLQVEHDAMSRLIPKGQRAKKKLKTDEDKAEAYVRNWVNYTPKLRYKWKNPETQVVELEPLPRALRRYIQEIRDPVVRHRVELFDHVLDRLLKENCTEGSPPAHIVVECVRELAPDDESAQAAYDRRQRGRDENRVARETLAAMGAEITDKNIRKFRLLMECHWKCPYTLDRFMQAEFDDLVINRIIPPESDPRRRGFLNSARAALHETEVEHMVPQSGVVCDEWFNVTVTRSATNKAKDKLIPYEFVLRDADPDRRERLLKNAEDCFGKDSLKFKIFSRADARSFIQEREKLQRTAYIARCLRYVCLLKFGWLSDEDRDPAHDKANDASRGYLVTNGGITRRLRKAWNLDELLRDNISSEQWAGMSDPDKKRALSDGARIPPDEWRKLDQDKQEEVLRARRKKNRQDVRHHALDAMVAACTLPWAANSTVWAGGWCNLDAEDGSVSSVKCPVFGGNDFGQNIRAVIEAKLREIRFANPEAEQNAITHYRSRERHKQVFDSQLYGRRATYGGKPLDEIVFIVAKKLSELTPAALTYPAKGGGDSIFSEEIRKQIAFAWQAYTADPTNWRRLLDRARSELLAEELEAKDKPKTLEAIRKRLWIVEQWVKETPNEESWTKLQGFLQQEKARRSKQPAQRRAVFPDDFIATLRHWRYGTPIRSVQVIAQTKDENAYAELRPGSKTFWKYTGRYKEMRVYDAPPKSRKGTQFVCWLVRPFYPPKRTEDGKLIPSCEVREASMPGPCRGQRLRAVFRNGQVVRFKRTAKGMDISHNWLICETNLGSSLTNATIKLIPAHLARAVKDPDDPRKTVDLKKEKSVDLALNEFMLALRYEPLNWGHELPHPASVKPESAGAAET